MVARWLTQRGRRRHVVLTSRRGLPERGARSEERDLQARAVREAIEALEAEGAQVTVAAVDVANAAEMGALVSGLERPLRGVVHAAGVSVMGPLSQMWTSRSSCQCCARRWRGAGCCTS